MNTKPSKTHCYVSGTLLVKLLAAQPLTPGIKVLRGSYIRRGVPPAEALLLVRNGTYLGKINCSGRLLQITEVDHRLFPVSYGYWDDRAVLRYTRDLRNLSERTKNRETAALWDRMLTLDPPPRSWRRYQAGE
jgi:hypothetical protein